jgi:hypothetical protein
MKTHKYKCQVCNRMISRRLRQWKTNFLRYQRARICEECMISKLHLLQNAKEDYNHYHRIMYPNSMW